MAVAEKFVGFAVSIDCGDILGMYQGQISAVNSQKQTISIVRACRNGIPCKIPEITISSPDIQGLRILKSPKELEEDRRRLEAPSTSERSSGNSVTSSTSSVSLHRKVHPIASRDPLTMTSRDPNMTSQRDPMTSRDVNQPRDSHQPFENTKRYAKEYQSERRLTPKKSRNRNKSMSNVDDCFNAPIESFDEEFDFEKNLAKFDKRAVWEEIENSMKPDVVRNADKRKYTDSRYNDKNAEQIFRSIDIPEDLQGAREYITDSNVVVPSVCEELRHRVYGAAEQLGYTAERLSETSGRCIVDLVLQLIGAKYWLAPTMADQRPSCVLLCCLQTYQSAWVVNAARHLANRHVNVKLVICQDQASSLPVSSTVSQEISLYKTTPGRITMDVRDLMQIADDPVDIIVDSVDCSLTHRSAPFYRTMVEYSNRSKAPVLAIDPCRDISPSPIDIKWSLAPILPLSLGEEYGNLYLADLGFTKKLFSMVGVKYSSPFAHQFVVPLKAIK